MHNILLVNQEIKVLKATYWMMYILPGHI